MEKDAAGCRALNRNFIVGECFAKKIGRDREERCLEEVRQRRTYQAIQECHQEQGFPIEAACKLLHVARSAYHKWATGKRSRRATLLHRLIELIKEDGVDLSGKFASQITTSKHFYDVTAHRYVEENCVDLGLKVVRGLSADMDDLLTQQGQREARNFFDQLMFSCQHGLFVTPPARAPHGEKTIYQPTLSTAPKSKDKDVVIVTNYAPDDENLQNMIADFRAALPFESRVVNLREFPFAGGCLGCFGCAITGKCVYKDGFDEFLRNTIQNADAFVYAFTISDHYTHSSFKCYDDRQFCNGHRTVTHGTPIAYLISGDYQYESNLRMIVEGRSEVGGNYLCGVATDEGNTAADIQTLADSLVFALEKKLSRPANFYGVGGMKIFRDLIYIMQGMM